MKMLIGMARSRLTAYPAAWGTLSRGYVMAKIQTKIGLVAATMLAASGYAGLANAQEGAAALEEIVVTARRVEERLQDVPLAISAFSAAEIASASIENLDDVANFTPGMTFSNLFGEFLPVPVIRGIAPTAVQGRENNAAIFVDGVFISGREGLNFSQLDLERIEVVKGPQAAMYGRNSFSGAINFVTARPTDELQGKAELTFGDNGRVVLSGAVSGPIIEGKMRGRLAIMKNEWDGSYENQVTDGPDIGGFNYDTFQGSLHFTPTEQSEIGLSLYVSNDDIDNSAVSALTMNCENTSARGERLANYCGELPSIAEDDLSVISRATGENRDVVRGSVTLRLDHELGTFAASSGYSNVDQTFFVDGSRGDGTTRLAYQSRFSPFPRAYVLGTFDTEWLQIGPGDETEEFSQEIRFTSPEDRALRYSVGAYYYTVDAEAKTSGVVSLTPQPFGFSNFCPCVEFFPGVGFAVPAFPGTSIGDLALRQWFSGATGDARDEVEFVNETDAWAVFGSVDWDLSERLTGRVELRYTDEDRRVQDFEGGYDLNNTWDFLTWRATLDYKPSQNTMFYGSIAGAEKSGDFDFDTDTNINGEMVSVVSYIDPEKNTSFELGVKGTYLGGRLNSDIAVYFIDWSKIVIPQLVAVDPNGVPLTELLQLDMNAGDASVQGLEATLTFAFTDNLTGSLGFSLTDSEFDDAKIESFADFPSFAPDGDVSGNELLRQSAVQANGTLTYRREFRGDMDWYVRGDVLHTGSQWLGAPNQAEIPAHTYVNLRLGLDSERFTLEVWSENLFDDDKPIAGFRDVFFANALPGGGTGGFFDTLFPFRITLSHPRRRQVGVTARFRF